MASELLYDDRLMPDGYKDLAENFFINRTTDICQSWDMANLPNEISEIDLFEYIQ